MLSKFVNSLAHFADRWSKTSQHIEDTLNSYDPELRNSTEPLDSTESQEEIQRQAALEEENRKRQYYRENKWIATDDSLDLTPTPAISYTGDLMALDFASFLRYVLKRYGAYTQWTHPFARHVSVIQIQRLIHITRLLLLDVYPQAPEVVKQLSFEKKPLATRLFDLSPEWTGVQRDLYSAFLIRHVEQGTYQEEALAYDFPHFYHLMTQFLRVPIKTGRLAWYLR